MEKYGKPCILIAEEGEDARGSGRSVEGFSLIGAIAGCKEHLLRYGGHTMAAGLSLAAKDIPAFAAAIEEQAREMCPLMPPYALHVDRVLDLSRLTVGEFAGLSCLEPFGSGNEYPLFALSRLRLEQVIPMGGGANTCACGSPRMGMGCLRCTLAWRRKNSPTKWGMCWILLQPLTETTIMESAVCR